MTRNLFLNYFLFCFVSLCFCQSNHYQFRHLSTTEGLSQSSAIAIHQDKLGQIWIGTRDGLNKYDGHNFTVYRNEPNNENSLSNNDILSIEEDTDGFLWIGTYNGLNKYDPKTNTFTRYFHNQDTVSLSNNTVWVIKELSDRNIWIGTSNGLSVYDKSSKTFRSFFTSQVVNNSLAGNHILSILETKDGSVYIGTTEGISKMSGFKNQRFSFETIGNSKIYVQDIIEGLNEDLLIATRDNGVLNYSFSEKKLEAFYSSKEINNVRKLLFDDKKQLWVGTYDGLYIVDKNNATISLKNSIGDPKSLSKNSIKSLFKDKKGSIWIGTYYGGVNIWDESNINFINFTQRSGNRGLNYSVVSSIAHYDGLIYFGTEGGGISVFDKNDNAIQIINKKNTPELSNNNIKSLFLAKDKKLWIGTFNSGLAIYNLENKRFENTVISNDLKLYLENTGVYTIKEDSDNMWLGSFGKGLIKYDKKKKLFNTYTSQSKANTLSNNLVRTLIIDSKKNVWIGTERGLNVLDPNGIITNYFYDAKVQSGDDISTILEDNEGVIWVGTKAKGLYKFNGTDFITVNLNVGSSVISNIHSILEDAKGNLWISSNQGLLYYETKDENITLYTQKEGLVSNEFNDNASLRVGKSQFYFGGPTGVTFFDSEKMATNSYSPQVIITDFKIKNKSVTYNKDSKLLERTIPYTEAIELSHEQGNFSVSFAIPNFINSSSNHYKYRLSGLENDWIETFDNTASYTIQNAGDYTFEVKGANSDGIWNENATSLNISVKPAPWRSWWAFLLYSLMILTALYFLITILKSRAKLKHQLDFEHLETQRTKEANKAKLEFFTNISHEFRTPLTLILGPLHQILEDYKGSSKMYKKLMVIESSANHLLQLINRLMDFRKLENNLFKLEAAEGNIVKFLKEIYLSFSEFAKDGDYDYSFHTTEDEILIYYDRYKLERVFYNLISNAFRYTPSGGKIAVRIKQLNNSLIIQVEDSGVGIAEEYQDKIFERFFEVAVNNKPDNDYNKGTGIGLSIAKNIVSLHKGKISVRDNDNKIGSVFVVELPLGRTHLLDNEIIQDFKFSDDISQYVTQLEQPNSSLDDDISEQIVSKEKPTILLVEDNKQLRKFMRSLLKQDYNILEAENGKIAYKIAVKDQPDLIVSDVVMPIMVGTELCSAIKEDIKTSHIPIILLTSRSSLIYRLEGLESGADDYISKPFNVKEFKLRIDNLLKSTSRLKTKFSGDDTLEPNEIIVSSLDEKLFKKALEIVEENIGNDQFDVPYFCSELGVSRTMLFVKVKAWTNFTPNEFIQHFRMKRAAQLLEQGKINISEVSYKVGFKNPKYFSKCFQKKFGETPTQYSNKFSDFQ